MNPFNLFIFFIILVSAVPIDTLNEERGDTKDHPLSQWFMNFSEADELLKLAAARQQVMPALFYYPSSIIARGLLMTFILH